MYILLASRCFATADRIGRPDVASPLTTEGCVKYLPALASWSFNHEGIGCTHNLVVLEESVELATARELCGRGSPASRIGITVANISRHCTTSKVPDADVVTGPLGCIDTTTLTVEVWSVRSTVGIQNSTAGVHCLTRSSYITIGCAQSAGELTIALDGATLAGVQSMRVTDLRVDTFDDINLASRGPIWSKRPAGFNVSVRRFSVNVGLTMPASFRTDHRACEQGQV